MGWCILPRDLFHRVTTVNQQTFGLGGTSGLANLDQSLTINGQTVAPTFLYEGKNATASAWTATVGEDLAINAGGPAVTTDRTTPLLDPADKAVKGNAGEEYLSAGLNPYPIGTDNFVFSTLIRTPASVPAINAIAAQFPSGSSGWELYHNTGLSSVSAYLHDGALLRIVSTNPLCFGCWNFVEMFYDGNGVVQFYANGASSGTPVDVSAQGSLTVDKKFALLGRSDGILPYGGEIAYFGMWQGAAWFPSDAPGLAAQLALHKERFAKLTGTYASLAKGTAVPTVATRASTAHLDINRAGVVELYRVGAGWMRQVRRRDASVEPKLLTGHLVEEQRTNAWVAWSGNGGTHTANSGISPSGENDADLFTATSTSGTSIYETVTATSADWSFGTYVKAGSTPWVAIAHDLDGSAHWQWFNAETGEVGSTAGTPGTFSYENCGSGWWRITLSKLAVAGARSIQVGPRDGDGSANCAAGDTVLVWGGQQEAGAFPTSYIKTAGAAATRVADVLYLKGDDGNIVDPEGTIYAEILSPNIDTGLEQLIVSLNDGGSSSDRINVGLAVIGDDLQLVGVAGGSVQWNYTDAANQDLSDDKVHAILQSYKAGEQKAAIDGSAISPDGSGASIPNDLDRINIGSAQNGGLQFNGVIGNLQIFKKALPDKVIANSWENLYMANYGGMGAVAQSTATALTQDTYGKLTLGATADASNSGFTFASDVLTYAPDDGVTRNFLVTASISFTGDNGAECHLAVGKNGTAIAASEKQRTLSATASVGNCGLVYQVQLADGDTIEIQGKSDNASPDITVQDVFVAIVPVLE